jgi:hypothetical protein
MWKQKYYKENLKLAAIRHKRIKAKTQLTSRTPRVQLADRRLRDSGLHNLFGNSLNVCTHGNALELQKVR